LDAERPERLADLNSYGIRWSPDFRLDPHGQYLAYAVGEERTGFWAFL
jgi:hypothetical protein